MNALSDVGLQQWKSSLAGDILRLEAEIAPLQARLANLREKLKAIETLLGSNDLATPPSGPRTLSAQEAAEGGFTPAEAFWEPIAESIVERGGREHSDVVLTLVERKMRGILKPVDFEILPSGGAPRWRNRAQWQRQNMIQQGILRRDSPRGIWEITPEGRLWLATRKGLKK